MKKRQFPSLNSETAAQSVQNQQKISGENIHCPTTSGFLYEENVVSKLTAM
jgi:hypothetical protein